MPVERQCEACGSSFRVPPSRLKNGGARYCSVKCSVKTGAENANWKGGLVERRCLECGARFLTQQKTIRRGHGLYCSKKCVRTVNAREQKLRASEQRATKQCKVCGVVIRLKQSHAMREGSFCSRRCLASAYSRGINRENVYSRSASGRRDDLGGLYVRSRWEANWARYLNWLIRVGQISSWVYEARTFEFPVRRGSRFYTPDFLVTNGDGTQEHHEVKGWMDQKSATKLKRMALYYPAEKIVLVDQALYKEVESKCAGLIEHWEFAPKSTEASKASYHRKKARLRHS